MLTYTPGSPGSCPILKFILSRAFLVIALAVALFARALGAPPKQAVQFQAGDRVCFIGDSITHSGGYHSQVVLFYVTRFPQMRVDFFNCGLSGDSAGGGVNRYTWDIAHHKPTVATLMFGMNDVGRSLYAKDKNGPEVEAQRQSAIDNHCAKMKELAGLLMKDGSKLIFLTPSPYDQTGRQKTENLYGVDYALGACAYEARKLADSLNSGTVGFHLSLNRLNSEGQAKDPNYTIIGGDRVHPGPIGHLVMGYCFLKAQGQSPYVSVCELDAAKAQVLKQQGCAISKLEAKDGGLSFESLESALPFPVDKGAQPALELIPFTKDLNQEILRVEGLQEGSYELSIDGQAVAKFSAAELKAGANLATLDTPQLKQAQEALALLKKRADIYSSKLRTFAAVRHFLLSKLQDKSPEAEKKALDEALERNKKTNFAYGVMQIETYLKFAPDAEKLQKEADELLDKAYAASQPKPHLFELKQTKRVYAPGT